MTLITRESIITGETHSREIDVDPQKVDAWLKHFIVGFVQDVFPELSPVDREFIFTGITPEEWKANFIKR